MEFLQGLELQSILKSLFENQGGSTTYDVYDCCLIFSNLDE